MTVWSARQIVLFSLLNATGYLPRRSARALFGVVGVATSAFAPTRIAQAHAWSKALAPSGARARTTLRLLAHRGQTMVDGWTPAFETPDELLARVRVEGRHHLDALAQRGGLLLGLHIGVPLANWALAALGYRHVLTGSGLWSADGRTTYRSGWSDLPREVITLPAGAHRDRERALALFRMRGLLRDGRLVRVIADGEDGDELFRIPIVDRALVVRRGWWMLRRQAAASVVPMLTYADGDGAVLTAYPPLPDPVDDPIEDMERCRVSLTSLLHAFVTQHPEQCLPWRFRPLGESPSSARQAAV